MDSQEGKKLLAHKLAHTVQQGASLQPGNSILRSPKKKIIGWVVRLGGRKLIKKTAIYTEKEMVRLLGKGFNILVRDGSKVAERVAEKVWKRYERHEAHLLNKSRKKGLPHYQPINVNPRAGEKGLHIFYQRIAPFLFLSESESLEKVAIYEDLYPGQSFVNYLTITYHAGEESWLSLIDWINPFDYVALAGDVGRSIDREINKKLLYLVVIEKGRDGSIQNFIFSKEGQLTRVIVVSPEGKTKELMAREYYKMLENK